MTDEDLDAAMTELARYRAGIVSHDTNEGTPFVIKVPMGD